MGARRAPAPILEMLSLGREARDRRAETDKVKVQTKTQTKKI